MMMGEIEESIQKLTETIAITSKTFGDESYKSLESQALYYLGQAMAADENEKKSAISVLSNSINILISMS